MKNGLFATMFILAGCGMSYESTHVEYGQLISHTQGSVGFASAESTTEIDGPYMQRCLAEVGTLPTTVDKAGQTHDTATELCLNKVVHRLGREERALDEEANERYFYGW